MYTAHKISEVWPMQTPLQITVFAVRLKNVLNTSWGQVNKNSLTWWYVLKTSWRHICKMSWKRLEDVLKTFLQDVLKTSWKRMAKTNILVLTKKSWRRFENVFWRRMTKVNILVLIKTSSEGKDERRLQDVLKTSSSKWMLAGWRPDEDLLMKTRWRPLHQDECCLHFLKRITIVSSEQTLKVCEHNFFQEI